MLAFFFFFSAAAFSSCSFLFAASAASFAPTRARRAATPARPGPRLKRPRSAQCQPTVGPSVLCFSNYPYAAFERTSATNLVAASRASSTGAISCVCASIFAGFVKNGILGSAASASKSSCEERQQPRTQLRTWRLEPGRGEP